MNGKLLLLAIGSVCLTTGSALAQSEVVYKHDQFSEDINTAAAQISSISLNVQPGFVLGEAFGQLYKPTTNQYPIKINAIEMFLSGPPNLAGNGEARANIEIWLHSGTGAQPSGSTPFWSISTDDLFNPDTGTTGMPLTGNTAFTVNFDWQNPDTHPPEITSGNFSVMIRYLDNAQSLQNEWGTINCRIISGLSCGCQQVAPIHDQATTSGANIFNIVTPLGNCSGNTGWMFIESLGATGDVILRVRALVGGCASNCAGKVCGDDGCGGSCGSCQAGESCNASGQCVCAPNCTGKVCGDDGCGGSCGSCQAGESCNASGQCVCAPNCTGKECGDDGCGGSCGSCQAGESCNASGQCVVCIPDCTGKECGDDDCGGSCGSCQAGESCNASGQCVCAPDCTEKVCGDDGCGGSCGSCNAGETCQNGTCLPVGQEVIVTAISPSSGCGDKETNVSIIGQNFAPGATVKLGGTNLSAVQIVSGELITATVPSGMEPGSYLLVVVNSDGGTGFLPDAFEVRSAEQCGGTRDGCGCGNRASPGLLALGLLLTLMVIRRRRGR